MSRLDSGDLISLKPFSQTFSVTPFLTTSSTSTTFSTLQLSSTQGQHGLASAAPIQSSATSTPSSAADGISDTSNDSTGFFIGIGVAIGGEILSSTSYSLSHQPPLPIFILLLTPSSKRSNNPLSPLLPLQTPRYPQSLHLQHHSNTLPHAPPLWCLNIQRSIHPRQRAHHSHIRHLLPNSRPTRPLKIHRRRPQRSPILPSRRPRQTPRHPRPSSSPLIHPPKRVSQRRTKSLHSRHGVDRNPETHEFGAEESSGKNKSNICAGRGRCIEIREGARISSGGGEGEYGEGVGDCEEEGDGGGECGGWECGEFAEVEGCGYVGSGSEGEDVGEGEVVMRNVFFKGVF